MVRRGLGLIAAALLGARAFAGCAAEPPKDPSYLLVELAAEGGASAPRSVRIEVLNGTKELTSLCVRLAAPAAEKPASFVLKRDFGKDPGKRVTVVVTAFAGLSGDDAADEGQEFACPDAANLPAPLGEAQTLHVDFCEGKARKLVVHAGATCCVEIDAGAPDGDAGDGDASASDAGASDAGPPCGACGAEMVCGAGLSSAGHACFPDECCAAEVSDACALEAAE